MVDHDIRKTNTHLLLDRENWAELARLRELARFMDKWEVARGQLIITAQSLQLRQDIWKNRHPLIDLLELKADPTAWREGSIERLCTDLETWFSIKVKDDSTDIRRRATSFINVLLSEHDTELFALLRNRKERAIEADPMDFEDATEPVHGSEVYISSWTKPFCSAALVLKWRQDDTTVCELPSHGKHPARLVLPPETHTVFP